MGAVKGVKIYLNKKLSYYLTFKIIILSKKLIILEICL
mgnify:CR=1 FL=1